MTLELFALQAFIASLAGSFLVLCILFIRKFWCERYRIESVKGLWIILCAYLTLSLMPVPNLSSLPVSLGGQSLDWLKYVQPELVTSNIENTATQAPNIGYLAALIWLLVVIVKIGLLTYRHFKFYGQLKPSLMPLTEPYASVMSTCKQRAGIKTNIEMYKTNLHISPFAMGIVRPKIILPELIEDALSKSELEHVLIHELCHVKHKDILIIYWLSALRCIFWFNPIIVYAVNYALTDLEITCDANAIKLIGTHKKADYGLSLLKTAEFLNFDSMPMAQATFFKPKHCLERRIHMIKRFQQYTFKNTAVSGLIIFSLTGLSAFAYLLTQETFTPILNASAEATVSDLPLLNKVNPLKSEALTVLSPYGEKSHPVLKTKKMHTGVDLKGALGDSIYAAANGQVLLADVNHPSYGNMVIIDHGNGVSSVYAHCDQLLVKAGQQINSGEKIATVGNTGAAAYAHLHFEVRVDGEWVDPLVWLK